MHEPTTSPPSVTVTASRGMFQGGETSVEVTVTHPTHHPAVLLNAASVAADAALRATDTSHPAHRSAQCGRTFIHEGHDTTAGRCAGLDGTEAAEPPPPDRLTQLELDRLPYVQVGGHRVYLRDGLTAYTDRGDRLPTTRGGGYRA